MNCWLPSCSSLDYSFPVTCKTWIVLVSIAIPEYRMNHRSPLARARGLGSARQGAHEWWRQRVTSIALIPLTLWLAPSLAHLPGAGYQEVLHWITQPWNSLLLLSFLLVVFYHAMQGLQAIIEDYVHIGWLKLSCLLGMKLLFSFLTLTALYAVFRILFV